MTTLETKEQKVPQGWRVKLYELEPEGAWVDKGTGYVACRIAPTLNCPALVVTSEDDEEVILLESKLRSNDTYEQQGGSF